VRDATSNARSIAAALACGALIACGEGAHASPGGGAGPAATQQVPPPGGGASSGGSAVAPTGAGAAPGAPRAPGSSQWVKSLSTTTGYGVAAVRADATGNIFTFTVQAGSPTLEKRDASGTVLWATPIPPACRQGMRTLGVAEDGRVAVSVTSCPFGLSLPTLEKVTLLNSDGSVASSFATGYGAAAEVNRFGELYAFAADAGAPLASGAGGIAPPPRFLRLIGPDGADRWVRRDGTLSPMPLALHPTADGGVAGVTEDGTAVFRLDRAGTLLWRTALPTGVSPSLAGNAEVLADGSVAVTGDTRDVVRFGDAQVGGPGQVGRALLVIRADGTPRTVVALPDPAPGQGRSVAPTALADGGLVAWEQGPCPRVWAFAADLSPRWNRHVDAACAASVGSATATRGALLLAGWLSETPADGGDFGDGQRLAPGTSFLLSVLP